MSNVTGVTIVFNGGWMLQFLSAGAPSQLGPFPTIDDAAKALYQKFGATLSFTVSSA